VFSFLYSCFTSYTAQTRFLFNLYLGKGFDYSDSGRILPVLYSSVDDKTGTEQTRDNHNHPEELLQESRSGDPVAKAMDRGVLAVGPGIGLYNFTS
jgi:hypothetical protein